MWNSLPILVIALTQVQSGQHLSGVTGQCLAQQVWFGHGLGSQYHPRHPHSQVLLQGLEAPYTSPALDRDAHFRGDPADDGGIYRNSRAGSIQVNDMQASGTQRTPASGRLQRVVMIDGGLREVSPYQANTPAVLDVYGRVDVEGAHSGTSPVPVPKSRRMQRPDRELFSGWNWKATRLPASTADAKGDP